MTYYLQGLENTFENVQKDPIVGRGGLLESGQYRDIPASVINNYLTSKTTQEETIAAIRGTPVFNPAIGPQINTGQGFQPFIPGQGGQGFNALGQGFFTPQILQNQLNAIQDATKLISDRASGVSTATIPTVPTRGTTPVQQPDSFGSFMQRLQSIFGNLSQPAQPTSPEQQIAAARQTSGFISAQNDVTNLQNDLRNFEANLLVEADKIKAKKGVSSAFVQGKLVKLDADMAEQYRAKRNAVSEATERLQMANQTVNQIIQLTQQSYQNAREQYEFEFNKGMQFIQMWQTQQNRVQDEAQANITAFVNVAKANPAGFQSITPEQTVQWESLDLKAGYELGTTQALIEASVAGFNGYDLMGTLGSAETGYYSQWYNPATKDLKVARIEGTGMTPDTVIVGEKDLTPDLRNSIIDTLSNKEGAKSLGKELSLLDMIRLFPEVNRETLQDYMNEFYDYESLIEDEKSGDGKPWWKFWN